jgi:hypothetical protein
VPNILEIIPPRVPLTDARTGMISREWYRFFFELFTKVGPTTASIEDLQLGPNVSDTAGEILAAMQQAQLLSPVQAQVDELAKQVEALATTMPDTSQLTELAKQVEALTLAPPTTPQLARYAYGSFYDTTTQTAAAINTAYAMTFNTTDLSNGVYLGSPTSRVYVDRGNVYNIAFSAQMDNTSGGSHLIYIWLRVNGADVPNTAGQIRLKGTDGELVSAWNFLYSLNAGDYFELMWSVSDTSVVITSSGAVAPVPAIPSVILTVTDNIRA